MNLFDQTYHYSELIDENEFYKHYYNESAKYKYDANFIELKFQPIIEEFQIIESIQIAFSERNHLDHIKFYWPENSPFTQEIVEYFDQTGYELEFLELYLIDPEDFSPTRENKNVTIEKVTKENLALFKKINYQQDLSVSPHFAKKQKIFYEDLFNRSCPDLYLSMIGDQPVGSAMLIESDDYIEIDGIFTFDAYRNLGVATELQKKVMNEARKNQKQVILVADGEDSPRDMYKKQGYQYNSYRLGAQYIF